MGQQIYTSGSGSFTVPAGVTSLSVKVIGGGCGGCSGNAARVPGGGGGGCAVKTLSVTPGDSISYAVGAGGPGDFGNTHSTPGGTSYFGDMFTGVIGYGGGGGSPGPSSDIVGAGGSASGGDYNYTGGSGGHGTSSTLAGGGGSSAGPTSNGADGSGALGGTAPLGGGNGGAGGSGSMAAGAAGVAPGGGGGGNTLNDFSTSNSGANGMIQIDWTDPIICGPVGTSSNSGYITADDSYTWNYTTVAADDPFLTLDVHIFGNATVTGLTFNGDALTLIGVRSAAGNTHRIECWGLVNPDIGNYVVSVTLSAAVDSVTCGAQYENVNQSYPTESFASATATNSGSADDAEATVSSPTSGCVIHAATVTDDSSITAAQTSRNNVAGAGGSAVQSDTDTPITPAAPTLMNFTGLGTTATWVAGAYAIRPTGSGSGFKPWFLKCNSYVGPGWVQ